MKKSFLGRILPVFLILYSLLWDTAASFADAGLSLELGSASANRGGSVTLPVTLTGTEPIRALQFDLQFDHNQIGITETQAGADADGVYVEANPANGRVVIAGFNKNLPSSGTLAEITFKVNQAASGSQAPVYFSNIIASDLSGKEIKGFTLKEGIVTISGVATETPSNSGGSPGSTPSTPSSSGGGRGGVVPSTPVTPEEGSLQTSIGNLLNQDRSSMNSKQLVDHERELKYQLNQFLQNSSRVAFGDSQLTTQDGKTTATVSSAIVQAGFDKWTKNQKQVQSILKDQQLTSLESTLLFQVPKQKVKPQVDVKLSMDAVNQLVEKKISQLMIELEGKLTVILPVSTSKVSSDQQVSIIEEGQNYKVLAPGKVIVGIKPANTSQKLTVYQQDHQSWKPIGGKVEEDGKIYVSIHNSEPFKIQEAAVHYQDLGPVQSWAQESIEVMSGKGFIEGRSDQRFDPMTPITRAEFVQIMVRSLDLWDGTAAQPVYQDVDPSQAYYKEIHMASKLGVVTGVGGGKFMPNKTITREEMATMISRTLDLQVKGNLKEGADSTLKRFQDQSKISSWARQAVSDCVQLEVLKGMKENQFGPKDQATRAQATLMMYRFWAQ